MSKYIKLEDAIEAIEDKIADYIPTLYGRYGEIPLELRMTITSLPTIDIVNCIECAYLGDDWWCYKHEFTPIPIEDYFCKDGERKDYE